MARRESFRERAVLDPEHAVFRRATAEREIGVQHIHVRVRFAPEVVLIRPARHAVLQRGERLDHLTRCPEVVELGAREGNDRYAQAADFRIRQRRVGAERGPEPGVELVGRGMAACKRSACPAAAGHQHGDRPTAQQPQAGVHKIGVTAREFADFCRRRLLEEKGDLSGRLAGRKKDAEIGSRLRAHHHPEPDDVGLGDRGERIRKLEKNISACDKNSRGIRGIAQDAGVIVGLHVEERLVEALAVRPTHQRHRHQNLSRGRIGGKPPAVPAGQDRQPFRAIEPGFKIPAFSAPCAGQQLRYPPARTELQPVRIAGGIPRELGVRKNSVERPGHRRGK